MFDLLISGGTVIDGDNKPRYRADVGIRDDRIEAVGDLGQAECRRQIDAAGKVVAPGFIDVHNHSDGWLLKKRHQVSKTLQGFTTEVLMSDGISYAPVNAQTAREWMYYLRALDGLRMDEYGGWESLADFMTSVAGVSAQNAVAQVPYANVRSLACGFGRQRVDDFRMRQIKADIQLGMEQGAAGLSTGLDYIVQCFSDTDELVQACSAIAPYDGLYVTHVRYKLGLLPALREAVEITRRAGVRLHVSHLKAQSPQEVDAVLEFIDTFARKEVDFSFDAYPYQPGSTMLSYLVPYDVWEDGPLAAAARLRDPVVQERFRRGLELYRLDLDRMNIAWVAGKENARHQGRMLSEYVAQSGRPVEAALSDLLIEERLAVLIVFHEGDDALIQPILQHDLCMIGSDGIYCEDGPVHPRQFGTATRVIGPCVRDHKLFSLEAAVHKLTGRAADRFRLPGRGRLQAGNIADVVVFDPATVSDRATLTEPRQTSVGIEQVLVGGVPIVRDGNPLDELPTPSPGRYVKCRQEP